MSKFFQTIFAYIFAILFAGFFGCIKANKYPSDISAKEIIFALPGKDIRFTVEVFDTERKREMGLMYRKTMPKDHGALFVFPDLKNHVFWMKNTLLYLDMIFFDDDFKVVGVIEKAQPQSLKGLSINKDSRYVLEVLAGTVKEYGINTDTRARFVRE